MSYSWIWRPLQWQTTVDVDPDDGTRAGEVVVEVSALVLPGRPGECYGPPEGGYPPEPPEVDIQSVVDSFGNDIKTSLSEAEIEGLVGTALEILENEDATS